MQKACTGCRICEIICSMEHLQKINTSEARISYKDSWPQVGKVALCRQCLKRACIDACPEEALYLNDQGIVQLDRARCTACMACSKACPFGDLPTDGHYPLFCDTCDGRFHCVAWCPKNALRRVGEKSD